jgi:esterase/lipase
MLAPLLRGDDSHRNKGGDAMTAFNRIRGLLLLVSIGPLAAGCLPRQDTALSPRHESSGLNSRFDADPGKFADYVKSFREKITRSRAKAGWNRDPVAVEMNAPYECSPEAPGVCGTASGGPYPPNHAARRNASGRYRSGVLLIHGLTDSPYLMRDLGRYFEERQGFLVRAIALPGHATVPGDLLDVDYAEWIKAVQFGRNSFEGEIEDCYLAGFSTGATLAVYSVLNGQNLTGCKKVKALFLFSPAIQVSAAAAVADWHKLYSWAIPRGKWAQLYDDRDLAKYESFAKNAAEQVYELSEAVKTQWERNPPALPIFLAQSHDDETVNAAAAVRFFDKNTNPGSRMLLYTQSKEGVSEDKRTRWIPASSFNGVNGMGTILSFSHVAIPNHPMNAHYGLTGRYHNCLHYRVGKPEDANKLAACEDDVAFTAAAHPAYGEKNMASDGVVLRRLTFNPHFEGMTRAMDMFLDGL